MSKFFGFERVMKARGKMADDVPVGQCWFLEENKSGLWFRRNKKNMAVNRVYDSL